MTHPESKNSIIIICGPTGIGKTSTAINIASTFNGEIIGADSMQVYRHMDIGTAKPTPEEKAAVRHHLVDVVEPDEEFDAARFALLADRAIADIAGTGRLPIVAGGTGLYIKSLVYGLFDSLPSDEKVRSRLREEAEKLGTKGLHDRLQAVDRAAAIRIHPNDTYRIVRALEIFEITGKPISDLHERHGFRESRYRCLKLGLFMDRQTMYERIDLRVDLMIKQGLLDEVRKLLNAGFDAGLKSMQSLGYRHMCDFLQGRLEWNEVVRTMKRDTRRYAKRQMTWFNADEDIHWINPKDIAGASEQVRRFLGAETSC